MTPPTLLRPVASGLLALVIAGPTAAAQTIATSPSIVVFSTADCLGDPPPKDITITNTGTGTLTWRMTGTPPAWLSLTPAGGSAPSTITVAPHTAGLGVGVHRFTITLSSNDPATPSLSKEVIVVILPCVGGGVKLPGGGPAGPPAVYEVELISIGFTGEHSTLPDCQVRLNGTDRLSGVLSGYEPNTPDDDVVYTGTLLRDTDVDYCLDKGRRRPGDDERVYCTASLVGFDATDVELTVYGDSVRGAWMKAKTSPSQVAGRTVSSQCDPQTILAVKNGYPYEDDGGGMAPNGQQIDDTKALDPTRRPVTFFAKGLARLRVGTYPPDANSGTGRTGNGWTLRVIRKIR